MRHVPPASGTVCSVASVTIASVPSEPTSSFAKIDALAGSKRAVELIAAAVERRSRARNSDAFCVPAEKLANGVSNDECAWRITSTGLAVIPDHFQRGDVVAGVAVMEGVAAAGVGRDHAANRGGGGAGRVRGEAPADLCQFCVQLVQHYARLNDYCVRLNASECGGSERSCPAQRPGRGIRRRARCRPLVESPESCVRSSSGRVPRRYRRLLARRPRAVRLETGWRR